MVNEWIFHICRNLLRLPVGIIFRKIHFENEDNFPKDAPVLVACNHPNSFLDGVVFEHISGKRIYTLTRGDTFLKPLPNYILRGMRLLPIFRSRDAAAHVARKGNAQTMEEVYEHFKINHSILIFTEGNSYPEKAVRRLKNGTGNMAVDMMKRSDFTLDLYVLPTALNYSEFGTLMQTVHVTYGTPIRLLDHVDEIKADERSFGNWVTSKVQENFDENVVITKGGYTEEKEFLHRLMINENYRPLAFKTLKTWKLSIAKANQMGEDLASKVQTYMASLKKHKVGDANVSSRSFDVLSVLVALLTAGVSFPIYVVWVIAWWGIDKLVKSKIRNIVFHDSIKVGSAMVMGLIIMIATFVTLSVWSSGIILFILGTLGIYGSICWYRLVDTLPYLRDELRWKSISDETRQSIIAQREAIVSDLS